MKSHDRGLTPICSHIVNSTTGILVQQFGQNGDVPTQSAFNY
jgi:hypothetical protein